MGEKRNNRSFVLQEPHKVTFEDREIPEIKDPLDVIVEVRYTGICGSDVHYWEDGRIGPFVVESPMVLGHESSGVIDSVGSEVTEDLLKKGDNVVLEPGIPCRRCAHCKGGKYNMCRKMFFAATPPDDGTLCRYYRMPSDFCYKIPSHVSLEEGALVEPLSVAVHAVRQAGVSPGQSVTVFGCGPVGLLILAVCKAFGASKRIAVDINDSRVKFAAEYAATDSFMPGKEESAEDIASRLCKECYISSGPDVAIDASGAEICIRSAVNCLRAGGTYVQAGMGKPEITFPMMTAVAKELNIKGSFRYGPGDWPVAVDLLSSGRVSVKELISKKVKFEEAEQAFKDTKAAKGIKILIAGPEN